MEEKQKLQQKCITITLKTIKTFQYIIVSFCIFLFINFVAAVESNSFGCDFLTIVKTLFKRLGESSCEVITFPLYTLEPSLHDPFANSSYYNVVIASFSTIECIHCAFVVVSFLPIVWNWASCSSR